MPRTARRQTMTIALSRLRTPTAGTWLAHLLVAALALPFILHQNSWYEWSNTLWLLELQTAHVHAHGLPSFFIDAAGMYLYPQQLFYAGPIISVLAYPSLIIGAWPMFAAATALAFAGASAGMTWTARNLGVPPWLSLIPGILFAVTPYTVSNLYGRGDWAELVAVAFLSIAIGAATSIVVGRAGSVPGVLCVLVLAVAGIAGTHNLTLLLGALLAPALGLALLPLLDGGRRELLRRYAMVAGAAITGTALCGVFLVPNVWLGSHTIIAQGSGTFLHKLHSWDRAGIIFDPLPGQPADAGHTYMHTQTLVAALAWCIVATAVAAARRWLGLRTVTAVAVLALTTIVAVLWTVDPGWWLHLPTTFKAVQFPFRLVTYIALGTVLIVAVLLSNVRIRASRPLIALLLVVVVWQVGVAVYLTASARAAGTPAPAAAPTPDTVRASAVPIAYAVGQQISYRLGHTSVMPVPPAAAGLQPLGEDSPTVIHLFGSQRPGTLVHTSVVASPLIHFRGDAPPVGVDVDEFEVLRVSRSPWQEAVAPVCQTCVGAVAGDAPFPLLAGRVLS
jgi:hypothetical protein